MIFAKRASWWSHSTLIAAMLGVGCNSTLHEEAMLRQAQAIGTECPPPRLTPQLPHAYYQKHNPFPATADNIALGKRLYERDMLPASCADCHGIEGDGQGPIGKYLRPPPTDFTCKELMDTLPDGRLFWVIQNGWGFFEMAPGHSRDTLKRPGRRPRYTYMHGHKNHLSEVQIWHLLLYIRSLSK
ncbi:c-type cytochrome [Methylomarinum vadi]|uniref:c-type cytochrome n=1 Tax=Methylomarinum vadi TaxID=438855 RepID=UPI00068A6902|nr:cytochrome c [Methylomarinum vadi]